MKNEELVALLKDMSLEEKVMQLVQLPGQAFDASAAVTGMTKTVPERIKRLAGSTLGIHGADKIRQIQKAYIEQHPHHIPLLFMLDVIHGHDTVFPCPLAQGATFEPELTETCAGVQAQEASADGVHVTFSPMADLVRDARWGRVMESTGEDPYVNSLMAAAMVRGYQGTDISAPEHVASCVKHFAAYGAAEAGRDYNIAELSESTLRGSYLGAYKAAIDAGAKMAMTSFNTVDGIPCTAHKRLLRDVLRGELDFDGVLVSDFAAIKELVAWGYAKDEGEACERAFEAGVDVDMGSECYSNHLAALVENGKLSEKLLDEAVLRVLRLKNELGLFEDPYHGADEARHAELALSAKSRALARQAVQKSLVLLENKNNALPLSGGSIAFIGPYADERNIQSMWAVNCKPETNVTIREAVIEALAAATEGSANFASAHFAGGCTLLDNDSELAFFRYHSDTFEEDNKRLLAEALDAAEKADTLVLCLGEGMLQSGESTSRTQLTLPAIQQKLFKAMAATGKRIITLVFTGRPLVLGELADYSDALLVCWRPGTEGGHGIVDVLAGRASPEGKLPMSFPYAVGQEPLYYNHAATGRPRPADAAKPSLFTSRYLDCPNEARYPFGYGLTYGDCTLSPITLSANELRAGEALTASVTVTNTGARTATETLQLYIRDHAGSRVRPVKELKTFKKITLAGGESAVLHFTVTEDMLRFWSANNRFESEPGDFTVFVGLDSATQNGAQFTLRS